MEPDSGARLSRASRDIIAGSVAGMVSKLFEHPFDLVKVRLQTQAEPLPAGAPSGGPSHAKPTGPQYRGAFDCFRQTARSEGFRGLYRGLSMPVAGATVENATVFFTYNALQSGLSFLQQSGGAPSLPQLALSAAGAGCAASFVLTPVELIKCRMQVQMIAQGSAPASVQTKVPGPLQMIPEVLRTEGIKGLWLGQTGTFLRESGGVTAWFLTFEAVTRWMTSRRNEGYAALFSLDTIKGARPQAPPSPEHRVDKTSLANTELIAAGASAGVAYNFILFPADSVKSTIQTEQELAKKRPGGPGSSQPLSFAKTFSKIYRTKGVRGLYAGAGITCLRSAPSSAIIFLIYNRMERLFNENGW